MQEARAMIRSAFAGTPRPGNDPRQTTPHACPECDEIAENLAKHTVETLPGEVEVIEHHSTALPLLSVAAFHYWLPAWLIRALDDPAGDVMEFAIFQLSPGQESFEKNPDYYRERFSPFSDEQRAAIVAYFREVRERGLWEGFHGELESGKALWSSLGRWASN